MVPGWRLGWVIVYNKHGYFDDVIDRLQKHMTIQLHVNSLVQAALPKIFSDLPESHFTGLKSKLKSSADAAFTRLSNIKGIKPIKSSAAMYLMVEVQPEHFKDISDDIAFSKKLLAEQNCFTFPSTCFGSKNFFRIIICTKPEIIEAFAARVEEFCKAHYK
jgi:tyrosine aminotransferase